MDRALKISQSNKQKSKNKICAREASQFQLAGNAPNRGTHKRPMTSRVRQPTPKIQCPPGNMSQALNIYCNM
jgi:hypothetical protein